MKKSILFSVLLFTFNVQAWPGGHYFNGEGTNNLITDGILNITNVAEDGEVKGLTIDGTVKEFARISRGRKAGYYHAHRYVTRHKEDMPIISFPLVAVGFRDTTVEIYPVVSFNPSLAVKNGHLHAKFELDERDQARALRVVCGEDSNRAARPFYASDLGPLVENERGQLSADISKQGLLVCTHGTWVQDRRVEDHIIPVRRWLEYGGFQVTCKIREDLFKKWFKQHYCSL